jgi:PAS domain S-box-containing protein
MKLRAISTLRPVFQAAILIAFYFAGGFIGGKCSFLSDSMALIWPPSGIALAAILLFGKRFWPGVALGAVLFSRMSGVPWGFFTLGTAFGNTAGALVCAVLLERFVSFDNAMERTLDVCGFVLLACFLGTTVNATFNVLSLAYAGAISWPDLPSRILVWWVPNALAGLVVAPTLIVWGTPSTMRWNFKLISEALLCGVGLVAGTLISFHSWFVYGIQSYPLAYLPFPFLVWGSLRFGQRGATIGTLLVSFLAIHSLLGGRGPFITATETESLMLMGSYIAVLSVTNMLLAAGAAERRRAERATSESEKRFRAVVEDQTDMICRFKSDGRLTFVNSAYCRFRGKSSQELIGADFMQTIMQEDRDIPLSYFNSLAQESPVVSFDQMVTGPDGQISWQQYTVRRLFPEQGNADEFQTVIQDITRRKQSEQALQASEEKYRSLVANIPDVVWTVNAKRELLYISPNVRSVLGYTRENLISSGGAWWLERTHPNDVANLELAFQKLFENREELNAEFRYRASNGLWIWLNIRAPGIQVRDGMLSADGLLSEITERKRAEEALQHAKEAADQHEPRTPHPSQRHHRLLRNPHGPDLWPPQRAPGQIRRKCP